MVSLVLVVLGVVVTLLTSVVKQEKWSDKIKQSITAALSLVGGIVVTYFNLTGTADLANVLQNSAVLLAIAQLVYAYLLRNSKLNEFLTSLHLEGAFDTKKTVEVAAVDVLKEVTKKSTAKTTTKPTTKTTAPKKATTTGNKTS